MLPSSGTFWNSPLWSLYRSLPTLGHLLFCKCFIIILRVFHNHVFFSNFFTLILGMKGNDGQSSRPFSSPRVLRLHRLWDQPETKRTLFCRGQDLLWETCSWTRHSSRWLRCCYCLSKVECVSNATLKLHIPSCGKIGNL